MNWMTDAERLVGVVDQDVLLADRGEDALAGRRRRRASAARRAARCRSRNPSSFQRADEDGQVDRPGDLVDVALLQLEGRGREQLGEEALVGPLGDLQADGGAPLALAEGLLDGREQAAPDLGLLDGQVAVAGDAEGDPRRDAEAAEEGVEPRADHVLQQDEPPLAVGLLGQRDEPVQDRRDLEHGVERPGGGLSDLDPQDQVEALVVQVRERVRRVDRQRREDRVDLAVEDTRRGRRSGPSVSSSGVADADAVLERAGGGPRCARPRTAGRRSRGRAGRSR